MPIRSAVARLLALATVYAFASRARCVRVDSALDGLAARVDRDVGREPQYPDVVPYFLPLIVALLVVPAASFAAGFARVRRASAREGWRWPVPSPTWRWSSRFSSRRTRRWASCQRMPGGAQTATEVGQSLVRRWVAWNWMRIGLDALGLYAATGAASA
jgi:hypothetical protein